MKKVIGVLTLLLLAFSFSYGKEKVVIEYNNKTYKDKVIETFNGGAELSGTVYPAKFYINKGSYPYAVNEITPTHDGGWMATENSGNSWSPINSLVKYDKDGNKEWEKEMSLQRYNTAYLVRYPDDPDRIDFYGEDYSISKYNGHQIIPSADGNYFVVSVNQTGVFVKIDPEGNVLWYNHMRNINSPAEDSELSASYYQLRYANRVCEINSENVNSQGKYKYYDSWSGNAYYADLLSFQKRDENTYYCGWYYGGENYNEQTNTESDIAALADGGAALLISGTRNIILSDGSIVQTSGSKSIYVWNKDGLLVDAIPLRETMMTAANKYYQEYGIDYTFNYESNRFIYIGGYDNGDILVIEGNNAIKYTKNENGKYVPKWYTPLAANGTRLYPVYNKSAELQVQLINETGGFALSSDNSYYLDKDNMTNSGLYMYRAENVISNREIEPYRSGYATQHEYLIFEFEEREHSGHQQAYLSNLITEAATYRRYENIEEGGSDGNYVYNPSMSGFKAPSFIRLFDGSYIVSFEYREGYDYDTNYYGGDFLRTVKLADGSKHIIKKDTNYIVLRVNKNNMAEWIKEYKILSPADTPMPYTDNYTNTGKSRITMDGRRVLIPAVVSPAYRMVTNDGNNTLVFNNDTSVSPYYGSANVFLIYDLQFDREVIKDPPTTTKEVIKGSDKVTENPETGVKDYIKEFIAILIISGILYFVVMKCKKVSMLNR